jgi:hypothetical protein
MTQMKRGESIVPFRRRYAKTASPGTVKRFGNLTRESHAFMLGRRIEAFTFIFKIP